MCPACGGLTDWQGYGTALKPAMELWTLVRKPPEGTVAANAIKHGTGALNIDGARIATEDVLHAPQSDPHKRGQGAGEYAIRTRDTDRMHEAQRASIERTMTLGRWPANLIHDGSAEATAGFPDTVSGTMRGGTIRTRDGGYHGGFGPIATAHDTPGDSGSAARFFYAAKSSRAERRAGLEHIETIVVSSSTWDGEDHQARLQVDTAQSPPRVIGASGTPSSDVTEWNTFLFGSGITEASRRGCRFTIATATPSTTPSPTLRSLTQRHTSAFTQDASTATDAGTSHAASAANSSPLTLSIGTSTHGDTRSTHGAERATSPAWWAISASVRLASEGAKGSTHPTHKPLALTTYLAALLLPPAGGEPRRIIVPFAGVGSEMIGASRAGWEDAVGIEIDPEYVRIAEARLRHWTSVGPLFDDA